MKEKRSIDLANIEYIRSKDSKVYIKEIKSMKDGIITSRNCLVTKVMTIYMDTGGYQILKIYNYCRRIRKIEVKEAIKNTGFGEVVRPYGIAIKFQKCLYGERIVVNKFVQEDIEN